MIDASEYIQGVFIRELKNRFLCEVLISGVPTMCYVPSSCHISNFLSLQGKKVLLIPTKRQNARTKYSLYAFPYRSSYILLNTSLANRAVANSLQKNIFNNLGARKAFATEHFVSGYKSDIFIYDTNTIIEVKSVLSLEKCAAFPTVFSERSLDQLTKIRQLVRNGFNSHYFIVSLNPYVKEVQIVRDSRQWSEMIKCIDCGLKLSAYACGIENSQVVIGKKIPIVGQNGKSIER